MGITLHQSFTAPPSCRLTLDLMREAVGLEARTLIILRTAEGKDKDGRAFAPLSEPYATRKQEALGTREANLQVSGRMLNDFGIKSVSVTPDGGKGVVKLGFTS